MILKQRITFDACHRLLNYDGNCNNLHGHTWMVEVELNSDRELNDISMLLDYRTIKQYFKDNYDHRAILNKEDPLVNILLENKLLVTILEGNPTAENLAVGIAKDFMTMINAGYNDHCKIIVHESADNSAEVCK